MCLISLEREIFRLCFHSMVMTSSGIIQNIFRISLCPDFNLYPFRQEGHRPEPEAAEGGYEANCSLPLGRADMVELLARSGVEGDDSDVPDPYTCFVPAEVLNR